MPRTRRDVLCHFCSTPCGLPVRTVEVEDPVDRIFRTRPICTECCQKAGLDGPSDGKENDDGRGTR